ncbi:MAG: BlaI/MecI/CopY family transcriptional regulator [Pirellula sp.]|jgi:predicted transcriptional regulator|nr:BlaI/MecI/CopY family transcriptional regulator [Pirellula sp.]
MELPGLSKGELVIAKLLCDRSPATVREIFESLPEDQPMDFATVQTYLRRLETKGYASSILESKTRIYSSKSQASSIVKRTVDELLSRLFGGSKMPLVRHLIEERSITSDELQELKELVDQLAEQKKTTAKSKQARKK